MPTVRRNRSKSSFPPSAVALAPLELDDVFSDSRPRRTRPGNHVGLKGKAPQLDVVLGANYRAVVIYAPKPAQGQDPEAQFVCIEPVAGSSTRESRAHGCLKELQMLPPGGTWRKASGCIQAVLDMPRHSHPYYFSRCSPHPGAIPARSPLPTRAAETRRMASYKAS